VNEVDRVQEAIATLLLDEGALAEWQGDPEVYAQRLPDERGRRVIAGLDPVGLASAALGMATKRSSHRRGEDALEGHTP
jgi:hypothetical protein